MSDRGAPERSELVFVPAASWAPAFLAGGIALALVGAFAGWVYAAIGGVVAVIALLVWIRAASSEISSLPREQLVDTSVLPAVRLRRRGDR